MYTPQKNGFYSVHLKNSAVELFRRTASVDELTCAAAFTHPAFFRERASSALKFIALVKNQKLVVATNQIELSLNKMAWVLSVLEVL